MMDFESWNYVIEEIFAMLYFNEERIKNMKALQKCMIDHVNCLNKNTPAVVQYLWGQIEELTAAWLCLWELFMRVRGIFIGIHGLGFHNYIAMMRFMMYKS